MSQVTTIVKTVTSGGIVYDVAVRYELTPVVSSLRTNITASLIARRQTASTSSTSFNDSTANKSRIWNTTSKASVQFSSSTGTDWQTIVSVSGYVQHDSNGIYNNGNGLKLYYKWGAKSGAVNSSINITIPNIYVTENVLSVSGNQLKYGSTDRSVTISANAINLYSCKLFVKYPNSDTYVDTGTAWTKTDRSVKTPRLTPSLDVFSGETYCTIYLKVYTYTDDTYSTLVSDQSNPYQARLFAGTNLNPSLTTTFVPLQNGSQSINDVCGNNFAETHLVPSISSYTFTANATPVAGVTITGYEFTECNTDIGTYEQHVQEGNIKTYTQTTYNTFSVRAIDSNGRYSTHRGPEDLIRVNYNLPAVSTATCYLDANNILHLSGTRSVTQSTIGTLDNKGYMTAYAAVKGTSNWVRLFAEEEFTTNGNWSKSISNVLSTANTYTVDIYVRDELYRCRGVDPTDNMPSPLQYTRIRINNVGLRPVLEMDNNGVYLYKNTSVTGNMSTTGNITTTNGNITAYGSVSSNNGSDTMSNHTVALNGLDAISVANSILTIGEDTNWTNLGKRNRFTEAPKIMSTNNPDSVDASLAQTGYCRLANNLLVQWKRGTVKADANGRYEITMPYPIQPSSALFGFVNNSYTYGHGQFKVTCDDVTATGSTTGGTVYGRIINTTTGALAPEGTQVYCYAIWFGQ